MTRRRARCARCQAAVGSAAAFCGACGASQGSPDGPDLAVELDLSDGPAAVAAEHPVMFAPRRGRRGRTIGGGAAVALVVAIGASVASGGDGGGAAPTTTAAQATTTAAPTTTTVVATTAAPTTAVSVEDTTSTSFVPPTTTTLGPVALGTGPLLGETTGLTVLATLGPDLHAIDLDTGVAQPLNAARSANSGFGGILTSVGFLQPDNQSNLLQLLRPGATEAVPLIDIAKSGDETQFYGSFGYIGEGPPGRLWLFLFTPTGSRVGYVEPDVGREFHATAAPSDLGLSKADGLGGVVFSGPGGVYRVQPGVPTTRVSTGSLLDAVNGHVLTVECDEGLRCRWRVLDLRTGATWVVALPDTDVAVAEVSTVALLAPDGRHVVVTAADGAVPAPAEAPPIRIVADDGTVTSFRQPIFGTGQCFNYGCQGATVWSRDGSWLFGLQDSATLWAWRPGLDVPRIVKLPGTIAGRLPTFSGFLAAGPTGSLPVAPPAT